MFKRKPVCTEIPKEGRRLKEQLITALDLWAALWLTQSKLDFVFYKLNQSVGPGEGMVDKAPQVIFPETAFKPQSPFLLFQEPFFSNLSLFIPGFILLILVCFSFYWDHFESR